MLRSICLAPLMLAAFACTTPEVLPFEIKSIPAQTETDPMVGVGDRADDPAIWVSPNDVANSLILGTNKDEGLHVYSLAGKELQFLDVGAVNNVDVRGNLAVASNDETGGISWFSIDPATSNVQHLNDTPVDIVEPYGICMGNLNNSYQAGVTYKDGTVQIWTGTLQEDGTVSAKFERSAKLETQLEGCVFDEEQSLLFIGEETKGIWSLDLANADSAPQKVDFIEDGNGLVADTEGLSLWRGENGEGYLVASAQASDRFVVYDRKAPHAPRGIITITASADGAIDAVTHTDGLDVSSASLPGYPAGILVVQDDGNPKSGVDQNFKIVDWESIQTALQID